MHPSFAVSLFVFLFSLFTLPAHAAPTATLSVNPALLTLGEPATLSLAFSGSPLPSAAPDLPPVDGLSLAPAGTMHQTVNGHSSVVFTYRVFPRRAGDFSIGPYALEISSPGAAAPETINIPAAALSVRPAPDDPDGTAAADPLFLRVSVDPPSPYVHQPFTLTLEVCSLPSVELARDVSLVGGLPDSGFSFGSWQEFQPVREEIDGRIYAVRRYRLSGFALTAGAFTLSPALRVAVVDRSQSRNRRSSRFGSFFDDDPFFNPVSATPVALPSAPVPLDVRPVPAQDRPPSYSGAVGSFVFAVDAKPATVKVGEPVTVSLTLSGKGDISSAIPPAFADSPDFKATDARLASPPPDPSDVSGIKIYEQVLIPRTTNLTALPSLSFAAFDPDAETFRVQTSDPVPLTVLPGDAPANALLLQIPSAGDSASPRAIVLGTDIVYLKPLPRTFPSPNPSPVPSWLPLLLSALLPPLLLLALALLARRRDRFRTDQAFARRRQAPRVARAALRRAEAALKSSPPDPRAVFTPLAEAASAYFAHRLNLPPGAATPSAILDRLSRASLPPDDLARWRDFFALSDAIRYGASPAISPNDLSAWPATLSTLLRQAERTPLP